ncbi:MAG: PA2778 family cysteine peptidase [Desulfatirhabdiaceae bacterium]
MVLMKRGAGRAIWGALFLAMLLLNGCAGLCNRVQPFVNEPERVLIESVPFHAQEKYQCGPAALSMILAWSGIDIAPHDLISQVYSPALEGSLQPAILASIRRQGRLAFSISGMEAFLTELAAGHPVLVLQNLSFFWAPLWHYAVVIGYDCSGEGEIILHSGNRQSERLPFRIFRNTWKRSDFWGVLALPPDRLPATATETSMMAAIAGLEQAGQWSAARTAYRTAIDRWPENFVAWIGLGNSCYSLSDFTEAELAFRQAIALQPENGAAFNNLAQALLKQGRKQEALAAAYRAIACGGVFLEQFQQTLIEVQEN